MKITVWELPFDWETFTAWLGKTFFKRFFFWCFKSDYFPKNLKLELELKTFI